MIAQSIIEQAGKKRRSGDWYVGALEQALSSIQDPDISESDTGGVSIGDLIFFQYGAKYPEKYEFWDLQPLSYVIEFYPDGFLGSNLHYINPDYRDAVARSLINSKGGVTVPKNSIHRYLYSGIGSLYKVPKSEDWGDIALLPTEKFIDNRGMKYPKHRAYSWSK
jgi:hypothetical protein